MTEPPLKSLSETSLPSASGSVKSGAGVPVVKRAVMAAMIVGRDGCGSRVFWRERRWVNRLGRRQPIEEHSYEHPFSR
ncbi:hypothetical protein GCM10025789_16900 [Tessaracoccus lubricantis]|uniref:Uncharacterized protein n=1 Tax=Tessaracoccus lubricantis TaxID=545543 RepID=A0ABP9FDP3_9ACTN